MGKAWMEVGDQVYVRRHESWDLNVGLVIGQDACLVIDTRASAREGRELAQAVRDVTTAPWIVVNTHAHTDHVLGNQAFRSAAIWSHAHCAQTLACEGHAMVADLQASVGVDQQTLADLADTELVVPDQTFHDQVSLTLGDREVVLRFLGRGHTDGDVIVEVPDAMVVFAGDLVRESGAPWFADSYPVEWPRTLAALRDLATGLVVPGHGEAVERAFVDEQRALLAAVSEIACSAYADGRPLEDVVPELPLTPRQATAALTRAYRELAEGTTARVKLSESPGF